MRDRAQRLRNFVRDLTPSSPLHIISSPMGGAGVPRGVRADAAQRAFVVDRMRMLAKAADVPLAKPGCDPNVIVIVTSNKSALLAALEQKHPDYFPADWSDRRIHRLERDGDPVTAVAIRGHIIDGWIAHRRRHSFRRYRRPGGAGRGDAATVAPASRLRPPGRHRRAHLDPDCSDERTERYHDDAVRDYAAMRTFVNPIRRLRPRLPRRF